MSRLLCTAALVIAAAVPLPALADPTASFANALAVEQAIDIAQTRYLQTPHCAPSGCYASTEQDPLAKPFVHSLALEIGSAAVINLGLRTLAPRSPIVRGILRAAVVLYPIVLIQGARAQHGLQIQLRMPVGKD